MERALWRAIESNDAERIRELTRQGVRLVTWPPFHPWTAQTETCWLRQCSAVALGRVASLAAEAGDRTTVLAVLDLGYGSITRIMLWEALRGRAELLPLIIDSMRLSDEELLMVLATSQFVEACDEVLLPRLEHLSSAALERAPNVPSSSVIRLLSRMPAAFGVLSPECWRQLGRAELDVLLRVEVQIAVASVERWTELLIGAITSAAPSERLDYLLPRLATAHCAPASLGEPRIMCAVAQRVDLAGYAPVFDRGFVITTEALQLAAVNEAMFYQFINRARLEVIRGLKLAPEMCEAAREFVGLLAPF